MGEGLYFSPKCFSQVNRDIACETAAAITSWAKDMDPGTSFFDLYCGNGFFSFLLKGPFRNRVGVENDRIAISCAGSAKKERGEEWPRFYRGRAEEVFPGLYEKYSSHSNAVLVDPPRSGMHGSLVNFLSSERSIDRIYYLSCDPSTMARDIRGLCAETGYRLTRIRPFDMFPRTAHIEVLAELVRE
jgi:tRNA/tmRNA/rRNA uracil-C5-methylase (TrmA/RlmC/RlmD family)